MATQIQTTAGGVRLSSDWHVTAHFYKDEVHYVHGWYALLQRKGYFVTRRKLTGLFAGPRMWFKSMDERMHIARAELIAYAAKVEERERAHDELGRKLRMIASGVDDQRR